MKARGNHLAKVLSRIAAVVLAVWLIHGYSLAPAIVSLRCAEAEDSCLVKWDWEDEEDLEDGEDGKNSPPTIAEIPVSAGLVESEAVDIPAAWEEDEGPAQEEESFQESGYQEGLEDSEDLEGPECQDASEALTQPQEAPEADEEAEETPVPCATIHCSYTGKLAAGTQVKLSAQVDNFPQERIVGYQWKNNIGGEFKDVPGATGDTYTFIAGPKNTGCQWIVDVRILMD